MKNIVNSLLIVSLFMINTQSFSQNNIEEKEISSILDSWHQAAADTEFETYFSHMSDDAIFIGTDPTENWNKTAFKTFSKPYFDNGKAWSFTAIERNVYLSKKEGIAWFDELLDTQMKICRGSGVLEKVKGKWKIKHYILSIAIPNEHTKEIVDIKKSFDSRLITEKVKGSK
jgi:hypothetical protein